MATMAAITNLSAPASTSPAACNGIPCSIRSQVNLKYLQKFSASCRGRRGHGSGDVFSSGGILSKKSRRVSSSAGARVDYRSVIEPQSTADESASDLRCTGLEDRFISCRELPSDSSFLHGRVRMVRSDFRCNCASHEPQETVNKEDSRRDIDEHTPSGGVAIAVKILQFYKREISPLLPGSCRFVPTCSEYGMQAFKKYGVVKGAVLTAWRLSRCNPLGGSGFDPPRWFDEPRPPPY